MIIVINIINKMNLSQLSDDQLKLFIQNIFVNYDRNNDGYL